jgi:hypothetical protein
MSTLTDYLGKTLGVKFVGQDEFGEPIPDDGQRSALNDAFAAAERDCPDTIVDKLQYGCALFSHASTREKLVMAGVGVGALAVLGGLAYAVFGKSES